MSQIVLGSYAIANRYNNSIVLRHFSLVYESLTSSIVSILKPLLADNSWINRTCKCDDKPKNQYNLHTINKQTSNCLCM